jgi:hypothetical protein
MFLETLMVGGGAMAAWFGRKTAPVRAVVNFVKKKFTGTKLGQSIILGNAEETIKNEYEVEKESLRRDIADLNVEKSMLKRLKEELEFLEFASKDETATEEERESFKYELGVKKNQHDITLQGIEQKESLIKNRQDALVAYEKTTLKERLAQAQIAQIVFKQKNDIEESQKRLDTVSIMGHGTMTNDVISRYSGHSDLNTNVNTVKRFEMKQRYKKFLEGKNKGN